MYLAAITSSLGKISFPCTGRTFALAIVMTPMLEASNRSFIMFGRRYVLVSVKDLERS